jgi:V/A-type H+-transporting ATPase subunit E
MSIERIIEKVIEDAKAEADQILKSNTEEVDRIVSRATEEANRVVEEGKEKAHAAAGEEKRKILAIAALETRKSVLAEKQRLIDGVFEEAVQRLVNGRLEDYKNFIITQLLRASTDGDEVIVLSKKDHQRLGKDFLKEVNSALQSHKKRGEISLAGEPADITGGFILRKGRKEMNCAVDALIGSIRDEVEGEIAGILFSNSRDGERPGKEK